MVTKSSIVKADAPEPNAAVSEAERLSTVEKVPIIVGSYSSGISFAAPGHHRKEWGHLLGNGGTNRHHYAKGFQVYPEDDDERVYSGQSTVNLIEQLVAPKLKKAPKDLRIAIIRPILRLRNQQWRQCRKTTEGSGYECRAPGKL